jgi:hypothetical protein
MNTVYKYIINWIPLSAGRSMCVEGGDLLDASCKLGHGTKLYFIFYKENQLKYKNNFLDTGSKTLLNFINY